MNMVESNDFYEIMDRAIQTKNAYHSMAVEDIAILTLKPFQDREDYQSMKFRIVYNLMNLHRN